MGILGKINPFSRRKKSRRMALGPLPEPPGAAGEDDWEMVGSPAHRRGIPTASPTTSRAPADPFDIAYPPVDDAGAVDAGETDPLDVDGDPDLPYAVDDPPLTKRTLHKCGAVIALLLGLALLTFGIVLLVTEESPVTAEDRYRAAIEAFDSGPRSAIALWAGSIGGVRATEEVEQLLGVGGVPTTTSVFFAANLSVTPVQWAAAAKDVDVSFSPGPNFTLSRVAITQQRSSVQTCTRDACSRPADAGSTANCRTSSVPFICSNASLQTKCQARFGPTAVYEGLSECVEDPAVCGSCRYQAYLADLCVVVRADGTTGRSWSYVPTLASCVYPFTERAWTHVRPAVIPVALRLDTDPYLALQAETKGTGSFAAAAGSISPVAVALIVIGALVAIGALAAGVVILLRPSDEERRQEAIEKLSIRQRLQLKNAKLLRTARRPANAVESGAAALYHYEATKLDILREDRAYRLAAAQRSRARDTDDRDDDGDGAATA
uniref:Transmembrane protein n=1 Tax=Neobodo designis TaxID=312471 RepID=A0A7S1PN35_NEODS|mmetsp:Transcript_11634/g.36133  ORF Transcript_11634/g.36133 Transcript_11634/m.36133 type:complete len:493 (+) Transcript_11634:73-1551(+)